MTIVVQGSRYYVPFMDGFKEISYAEAMYLYEQGFFTERDVEYVEYD